MEKELHWGVDQNQNKISLYNLCRIRYRWHWRPARSLKMVCKENRKKNKQILSHRCSQRQLALARKITAREERLQVMALCKAWSPNLGFHFIPLEKTCVFSKVITLLCKFWSEFRKSSSRMPNYQKRTYFGIFSLWAQFFSLNYIHYLSYSF